MAGESAFRSVEDGVKIDARGLIALGQTQKRIGKEYPQNQWDQIIGIVNKRREGQALDLLRSDGIDAMHPEELCAVELAVLLKTNNGRPIWIHSNAQLSNVRHCWQLKGGVAIQINTFPPESQNALAEYTFQLTSNGLLAIKMMQKALTGLKETVYQHYRLMEIHVRAEGMDPFQLAEGSDIRRTVVRRKTRETVFVHLTARTSVDPKIDFNVDGRCELCYSDLRTSWEPILLDIAVNGDEIRKEIRYRGGMQW